MKKILYFIFILNLTAFSKDNCIIHLKINNYQNLQSLSICNGADYLFYTEQPFEEDSICLNIYQPYPQLIIINDDYYNNVPFFLDNTEYIINIDATTKKVTFLNSTLNSDFATINNIKDSLNTAYNIPKLLTKQYKDHLDSIGETELFKLKLKERDSIYDILKKQYYTTNTTSFLALHYIYYSLMCNNSVANKEAMWPIFLKLDNKLYSYALYQQTKELLLINPETVKKAY